MGDPTPEQGQKTKVTFNGVNGATGHYGVQPLSIEQLVKEKVIPGWYSDEERKAIQRRKSAKAARFALGSLFGDPTKIADAGWGIVFPATAEPKQVDGILEALRPLIEVRQNKYYKVMRGPNGYMWGGGRGQSFLRFLRENGAGVGPVDPNRIPYYLLLVGDPQSIPYQFQYDLDVQYVTGRIYFESLDDYYKYAQSVAAAESGKLKLPRKAAFFGPHNSDDDATYLSSEKLIKPLVKFYKNDQLAKPLGFEVEYILPEHSTKEKLVHLFGGDETPALLFTAGHGVEWPYGDERQLPYQGALLCQDWPGPFDWDGELDESWFFSGKDIIDNKQACLHGLISFHFACFGAGTPYWDEFAGAYNQDRPALTRRPFLSALPKSLLSHRNGGALAVIGHVERTWSYSFEYEDGGQQLETFKDIINRLMLGQPVGFALNAMNERYTAFSSGLIQKVDKLKNFPDLYPPEDLAFEWISANDAKCYTVLGDPAVRLALAPVGDHLSTRANLALEEINKGELPEILDPNSRPDPELIAPKAVRGAVGAGQGFNAGQVQVIDDEKTVGGGSRSNLASEEQDGAGSRKVDNPPVARANQEPAAGQAEKDQAMGEAEAPATISPLLVLAQLNKEFSPQSLSSYGLRDDLEKGLRQVVEQLTLAFTSLANSMASFAKDVSSLEVETYAVPDLEQIIKDEKGEYSKALQANGRRVAWTHIKLDGDLTVAVPAQDGELDETLWAVHKDMVELAQANRSEMIQAAAETLVRLITPSK